MGQMIFDPQQSWEKGALSAPGQDLAPRGSYVEGENTILLHNTGETALVGQRAGWNLRNETPQSGSPAIIGQYEYIRSGGTYVETTYHLVVGSNGRLGKLTLAGAIDSAVSGSPTPFTSGVYPPSFATMNNLAFIANGVDPVHVFNGTAIWNSGLVAPAAPTPSDAGAGNLPADTYDVVVTYYDSATGLESSASAEGSIVLGASKTLGVSWTAYSGEHPVTHTRVYLRQQSNQTEFFRVAEIAVGSTSTNVSLTQDQLDALTLLAPGSVENAPPPVGLVGVEAHVSRLFGHDGSRVYFSNLDQPEAFDPENVFTVNLDDGQPITALHAAHEVLIVFKRDSLWALYGEDPATWTPRMISPNVGCLNERSIVTIEGVTYWWSEQGPMAWNGAGAPQDIALGRLDDDVAFEARLSRSSAQPSASGGVTGIVGVVDVTNQRILWAAPEVNKTQNGIIFPYKYRFGQWEATRWTGLDAASLASVQDSTSTPQVFLGGYKGQIFRYGGVQNDGTPSGAVEGTVASGTSSTLTIASGTLLTAGGGLAERYVTISNGTVRERKRIGSNTGTVITLASGETFTNTPTSAWTWTVGAIEFNLCLPWSTFGAPFVKKRLEYGYFWVGSTAEAADVEVELYRDYNDEEVVRSFILETTPNGLIWDVSNWDEAVWGGGIPTTRHRRRLAKVAFAYRWCLRKFTPNSDVAVYKVDCRAESQTDRR